MAHRTSDQTLFFLHIPKSAGTTLYSIIDSNYPKNAIYTIASHEDTARWKQLEPSRKRRFSVVRGHFEFGLDESLPHPAAYVTMLRDPVERVLSNYFFVRQTPTHRLHRKVVGSGLGIREFLGLDIAVDNGQARQLCGYGLKVAHGECSREVLEAAKSNLRKCAVVGLTERFDESVVLLQRAFGWKLPVYRKRNVTRQRLASDEVAAQDLDAIRRANRLDLELYEDACGLFDAALSRQNASFRQDLKALQSANAAAQGTLPVGRRASARTAVAAWAQRLLGRQSPAP